MNIASNIFVVTEKGRGRAVRILEEAHSITKLSQANVHHCKLRQCLAELVQLLGNGKHRSVLRIPIERIFPASLMKRDDHLQTGIMIVVLSVENLR